MASDEERDQEYYNQLAYYTLAHPDPSFVHQHLVDAFAAQHVDAETKPIQTVFALIGLYLCTEKHFTGKQVQRVHMRLVKRRRDWPRLTPPRDTGSITAAEVLAAAAGVERDEMMLQWCAAVWHAWTERQEEIRRLVQDELDIG
jgi:hypothetical protein